MQGKKLNFFKYTFFSRFDFGTKSVFYTFLKQNWILKDPVRIIYPHLYFQTTIAGKSWFSMAPTWLPQLIHTTMDSGLRRMLTILPSDVRLTETFKPRIWFGNTNLFKWRSINLNTWCIFSYKNFFYPAPGWLGQLGVCLGLRSWVKPCTGLPCSAGSLLAPRPSSCSLSHSRSLSNK